MSSFSAAIKLYLASTVTEMPAVRDIVKRTPIVTTGVAGTPELPLFVKMWTHSPGDAELAAIGDLEEITNEQVRCLFSELDIYKYIATFMVRDRFTPNAMFSVASGTGTTQSWIATPLWGPSLWSHVNDNTEVGREGDFRHMLFQIVYTLDAFAAVGMRHNDTHMNNLLVKRFDTESALTFGVNNTTYRLKTRDGLMFFDYDRAGIFDPIVSALRNAFVPFEKSCATRNSAICRMYNQCSEDEQGRRELAVTLVQFLLLPTSSNESLQDAKRWIAHVLLTVPAYTKWITGNMQVDAATGSARVLASDPYWFLKVTYSRVLAENWPTPGSMLPTLAELARLETVVVVAGDGAYNAHQDVFIKYADWYRKTFPGSAALLDDALPSSLDCNAFSV